MNNIELNKVAIQSIGIDTIRLPGVGSASAKGSGSLFHKSLVDAWFMSGYANGDSPASIRGVKGNELQLKNFAFTSESGFGEGAYEGALVFDGVDDYGICSNLPILDDYTVICRRVIETKSTNVVASKSTAFGNGAFIFEIYDNNKNSTWSFGVQSDININYSDSVSWQNKRFYNGTKVIVGSVNDTNTLTLGLLREGDARRLKGAIYYFALYNKSLTPEEIEEEKVKLEQKWNYKLNKS